MLLVVDVGNTRIKVAVFEKDSILAHEVFGKNEIEKKIEKIFKNFPEINNSVYSSVGNMDISFLSLLEKYSKVVVVSSETPFPFLNNYSTPKTLGVDRMVLTSGAVLKFPNANRLIIDAGTCITYDFVDSENVYHGGAISPGLRMRYEALHRYTAKLPELELELPLGFIGNSTAQSIHSGVVNAVHFEIDGFIDRYKSEFQDLTVILTGGDADFLAKNLKNPIFANSNFLLESLGELFNYITKND